VLPIGQARLDVEQGAFDRAEAIHVFDLGLDAEFLFSSQAHRDVGIAAQAALFHAAR